MFNDVAIELIKNGYDPKKNIDEFIEETHYYLEPLQDYFRNLTSDDKQELLVISPINRWHFSRFISGKLASSI